MGQDPFERTYLGADEAVFRDRSRSRGAFVGLAIVAAALWVFAVAALAAGLLGDAAQFEVALLMGSLAVLVAGAAVLGTVIRIVLTQTELRIQIGFAEQRIPISSIGGVSLCGYDEAAARFRAQRRGTQFFATARAPQVVELAWTDARGAKRTTFVANDELDAFVAALARVRGPSVRALADHAERNDGDRARGPRSAERAAR